MIDTLSPKARQIFIALNNGQRLTYAEMYKLFELRERQMRRWLKELREAGVPIKSEGIPKRFFIPEEYQTEEYRHLTFNSEEILALTVAGQAASATLEPTPLAAPLQRAFDELLAHVASPSVSIDVEAQRRQWYFGEAPSAPLKHDIFTMLRNAIDEGRSLRIDYYAARERKFWPARQVDPYCLVARSGSWLLVAYCHMRGEIREFNLVDISAVRECDPAEDRSALFSIPSEFDIEEYFRDRFNLLGGNEVYVVRLLAEADRAPYFRRKKYHPTQQIEQSLDDGRIMVSYEVAGLDEIRSFVQSWGTGVTVLEPEELRETIRTQADEIVRRYREGEVGSSG